MAEAVSTQLPGRGRHVPGETHTASVPDHAAGGTRWVRAGGRVGGRAVMVPYRKIKPQIMH